jgi:hypothetical protein
VARAVGLAATLETRIRCVAAMDARSRRGDDAS